MGFSAALTGTGICLERSVLQEVPAYKHTLTEDLEYGVKLELAGIKARYIHAAATVIDQPPSLKASAGQRVRWAKGPGPTALTYCPQLVWRGIKRRDISALDYAAYLLLPSLVPLQAFLLISLGGTLLLGYVPVSAWGVTEAVWILATASLAFSCAMTYAGLNVERREYVLRDWVAFVLLMLTWLPIALYGALTSWAATWVTTPQSTPYTALSAERALKRGVVDSTD